jgi:glutaconate CoA-transferase subunit B
MTQSWSREDAMIVAGSRRLRDGRVVFAGVGAPLLASILAQQLHAPDLTIVLEGGYIGPHMLPGKLPISTNEMRACRRASVLTGIVDVFLYAQRGCYDYGFVGAAQVDRFGNVNTSFIGGVQNPKVRLPGSGGANDIVSLCKEVFIITKHERRRFVERVDFVTSPGYLGGGSAREEAGLTRGRPVAVITDLATLGFDQDSKGMRLEELQPGVSVEEVLENTGFDLMVPDAVPTLDPPSHEELAALDRLRKGAEPASAAAGGEVAPG